MHSVETGARLRYDLSLKHAYPDFHPDFPYHGMNVYAYLLDAAASDTFAFVSVQLYESYSRAGAALAAGADPAGYLQTWAAAAIDGWTVSFPGGARNVSVDASKLVVGLSRGSGEPSLGKSPFFWPSSCQEAYAAAPVSERPRGYAFWNIPSEGGTVNGTNATLAFAPTLNAFLGVR